MKCYLTSIGEQTTEICKNQLIKYGFEVILLDKKEPWIEKYKRFLNEAKEDCIRIDADVLINKNFSEGLIDKNKKMIQFKTYNFYTNDLWYSSPVYYSSKAIELIKNNVNLLDENRPETSAWRLPEIHGDTLVPNQLVGKRVIVINAEKVKFTGNKMIGKKYAHHSGWPGGFKEFSLKEMMAKDSTLVITSAVSGMLPKNKLRSIWLKNLRVYKGEKND